MGKSVFILNSGRKAVMNAQFRRMRDELRGCELHIGGIYRDQSDAVAEISEAVRKRNEADRMATLPGALIATLAPQNVSPGLGSSLKVPFLLSRGSCACDSAGAVACSDITKVGSKAGSKPFRAADLEALCLLGVSVLRRLGVPSYFAYRHFDLSNPTLRAIGAFISAINMQASTSPLPCIVVPEGRRAGIYSFMPPYAEEFPLSPVMAALEVLDDAALLGLMRIKSAYLHTLKLLHDFSKNAEMLPGEAGMVAAGIGHVLHEGLSSWSVAEAQKGFADAKALLNIEGELPFTSMRLIVENEAVHTLMCPVHHFMMAAEVLLCDGSKKAVKGLLRGLADDKPSSLQDIMENAARLVSGHGCIATLMEYLNLAGEMNLHVHSIDECPRKLEQN